MDRNNLDIGTVVCVGVKEYEVYSITTKQTAGVTTCDVVLVDLCRSTALRDEQKLRHALLESAFAKNYILGKKPS